jgi:hypothetical protein
MAGLLTPTPLDPSQSWVHHGLSAWIQSVSGSLQNMFRTGLDLLFPSVAATCSTCLLFRASMTTTSLVLRSKVFLRSMTSQGE